MKKVKKSLLFGLLGIGLLVSSCLDDRGERPSANLFCPGPELVPDSIYRSYYDNDQLFAEIKYRDGVREGMGVFYHKNGGLKSERNYCGGDLHGLHRTYYEDGSLSGIGFYWDGKMTGWWYYFWPNGNLRERITFNNNLEHGPFEEYFEDGTLKASGLYLHGDFEHGYLTLYNEDGSLKRKMLCNKGICQTIST
ncbi:MAG: hypothetical protein EA411_04870 [Saprospirales bacterium]|nr:MAG: hypothetical protein EA411_04870 [Saprospirales bacterium]